LAKALLMCSEERTIITEGMIAKWNPREPRHEAHGREAPKGKVPWAAEPMRKKTHGQFDWIDCRAVKTVSVSSCLLLAALWSFYRMDAQTARSQDLPAWLAWCLGFENQIDSLPSPQLGPDSIW